MKCFIFQVSIDFFTSIFRLPMFYLSITELSESMTCLSSNVDFLGFDLSFFSWYFISKQDTET